MTRRCITCGADIPAGARFCPTCGTAALIQPTPQPGVPPEGTAAVRQDRIDTEPPPGWIREEAARDEESGPRYAWVRVQRTSGRAVASLVLGLATWGLTMLLIGIFTGFVTAPLAIGLGMAARAQVRDDPSGWRGSGMAVAGITLGLLWMLLATLVVSLMVFASAGWL